jgi:hypothetical protein
LARLDHKRCVAGGSTSSMPFPLYPH